MEIKVLGTGCKKCKHLMGAVENAVKALNVDAHVEKVEDIEKILAFNVMSTPALVINGNVVLSGGTAKEDEVKKLIQKEIQQ